MFWHLRHAFHVLLTRTFTLISIWSLAEAFWTWMLNTKCLRGRDFSNYSALKWGPLLLSTLGSGFRELLLLLLGNCNCRRMNLQQTTPWTCRGHGNPLHFRISMLLPERKTQKYNRSPDCYGRCQIYVGERNLRGVHWKTETFAALQRWNKGSLI